MKHQVVIEWDDQTRLSELRTGGASYEVVLFMLKLADITLAEALKGSDVVQMEDTSEQDTTDK